MNKPGALLFAACVPLVSFALACNEDLRTGVTLDDTDAAAGTDAPEQGGASDAVASPAPDAPWFTDKPPWLIDDMERDDLGNGFVSPVPALASWWTFANYATGQRALPGSTPIIDVLMPPRATACTPPTSRAAGSRTGPMSSSTSIPCRASAPSSTTSTSARMTGSRSGPAARGRTTSSSSR